MHTRRVGVVLLSAILFMSGAAAHFASAQAQGPCPNGDVYITDADRPKARAAGIPDSTPCWNPNSEYAGQNIGESKEFLRSILCPPDRDNYGGMGPDGTIAGLDGQFSVCAAKFLKAAQDSGINVCVREGARSVAKQKEYVDRGVLACKKGAQCEHPRGIAIDVNVRPGVNTCGSYRSLHQSASQYGVVFYLGCRDAYHFVPLKGATCSGGGTIQPDTYYDFPQYYEPYASPSPTSGLLNQFRQALGLNQPPPPPPPPSNSTQTTNNINASLPQPTQSQFCLPEYKCSGDTLVYQNSFCATQVQHICPAGCMRGACIAATSTEQGSTSDSTSTVDVLDAIGGVTATPSDIATVTPLQLILSLSDQASAGTATSTRFVPTYATGSIAGAPLTGAQQTFTSNDLSGVAPTTFAQPGQSTFIVVLESLKQILLKALDYLRPLRYTQTATPTF